MQKDCVIVWYLGEGNEREQMKQAWSPCSAMIPHEQTWKHSDFVGFI